MNSEPKYFIGAHLLARNTVLNFLGQSAPLLVAIFAIPLLIRGLGTERFGVLTVAWMVVGYFSLFDLGLGRALTKLVAEKLGAGQVHEIPKLIWTALTLMGLLGITGTLLAAGLSSWFVYDVLNIPAALRDETLKAFYLLALSIPIVISTTGLRGILEAYQRFGLVNAVRIPMGVFTFLGPLAVLPFSSSLYALVAVLLAGRLIAWTVHLGLCLHIVPVLRHHLSVQRAIIPLLLRFGGWMTITNIISPLMVYLDRFLIGAVISMAAVAYYTTPYEMVTRLRVLPVALVGVLFPAFSTILENNRAYAEQLFIRSVNYVFISLFPLILIIVVLSHDILSLWLGHVFANNSRFVLQWLAIGVFINSLTRVPFTLVQSAGRPDLSAKAHLIELPFYLLILFVLIRSYGIRGVAVAWVARVSLDAVIFFAMAKRLFHNGRWFEGRTSYVFAASILILVLGAIFGVIGGQLLKAVFVLSTLLFFAPCSWFIILAPDERALLSSYLKWFKTVSIFGRRV